MPITTDAHIESLNDAFNLFELTTAISCAKLHNAPGEDKIPYEMLQNLHKSATKVPLRIYNDIWDGGALAGDWKHVIILPLPKPSKDLSDPG